MRVLLIEDDVLLGEGLKVGLEQSGWVADWVRDGETGQLALEAGGIDVLVLDLGLPRRSGLEVLSWLRSRGNAVPVLILTASNSSRDRVTVLDSGADDFLSKPFDLDELCARLRALHRRAIGCPTSVLRHGRIEIDAKARSIAFDGEPLPLSPKEYAILETLVEHAGKVVPRQRLMTSIYGWDDDVGSNALEVHIHNLRKKLDSVSLTTIRGVGYKLD
jgi:two-component system response regulator QseB